MRWVMVSLALLAEALFRRFRAGQIVPEPQPLFGPLKGDRPRSVPAALALKLNV